MTNSQLLRFGGLGLFVGALAFVVHVVLRSMITTGVDPAISAKGSLWVPVNALGAAGGPASNLAANLLSNLGPVLLLIGLGYLGLRA